MNRRNSRALAHPSPLPLTITFEMASVLWTVLKTHNGRSATGALNVPVPLAALAAGRCQTVIVVKLCAHPPPPQPLTHIDVCR